LGIILELFLHQKDVWKLFVDAERWETAEITARAHEGADPAFFFDLDEPGYFQGMISGFRVAMDFSRPLTKELIREIHDAAVEPVYVRMQKKKIALGWRKEPTWFYITEKTSTPRGIKELREKCFDERYTLPDQGNLFDLMISSLPERGARLNDFSSLPVSYFRFRLVSEELITAAVDHLIEIYREEIKNAEDQNQKIGAIARFVQNLNQAHPFFDGNIRTFGVLLLNRLLNEQELPFCCLSNPNCLDATDFDQLVELIKEGQSRFLKILKPRQE
jgi:hypothetical protein